MVLPARYWEIFKLNNFPSKELGLALCFIALLAILYVGFYAVLVTPSEHLDIEEHAFISVPEYRIGGDTAKALFDPIQQLDLRLRPNSWKRHLIVTCTLWP